MLLKNVGILDHGLLVGLEDDDHANYQYRLGRSGGQTVRGGIASGEDLTLVSTSHSTKGSILFGTSGYNEANNRLSVGFTGGTKNLEVLESFGIYGVGANRISIDYGIAVANTATMTTIANGGWVLRSGHTNAPPMKFELHDGISIVERMMIDGATGNVSIGDITALAKLHIDQASTTDAIPVLYLDQADVSEEMIQFETTIGTGNAIEAVGAKALTTTHFIKVTIPGGLTRYIPVGTIA